MLSSRFTWFIFSRLRIIQCCISLKPTIRSLRTGCIQWMWCAICLSRRFALRTTWISTVIFSSQVGTVCLSSSATLYNNVQSFNSTLEDHYNVILFQSFSISREFSRKCRARGICAPIWNNIPTQKSYLRTLIRVNQIIPIESIYHVCGLKKLFCRTW